MKQIILLSSLFLGQNVFLEGFVAGTPVKLGPGYVPIEHIHEGDKIVSRGNIYGLPGGIDEKFVVQVIKQPVGSFIKIIVGGEILCAARDQFFLTPEMNWVAAANLKVGDTLAGLDSVFAIDSVELIEAYTEMYILSMIGSPHFCVSAHDIVARNFIPEVVLATPKVAAIFETTSKVVTCGLITTSAAAIKHALRFGWPRWR